MEERQIGKQGEETETMKKRKEEATVKRGPLGEQKEVREDREETRIGRARHLFFSSIAHSFLPRSLSFISSLHLSILSLALLPFLFHVRAPPFSALPFLLSIP